MAKRFRALLVATVLALTTAIAVAVPASAIITPTIEITNLAYHPERLVVETGALVKVVNNDGRRFGEPHSLTSDQGKFDTGVFTTGNRFFRAPGRPGVYWYHCVIHPFMTGRLKVV